MRSIADSLHHQAAEKLRQQIFAGELAPGSFVDEAALCEQLAVSRTPLREALKVLVAEGLLRHEPRRGCFVAEITARDVDQIFPVMALLEGRAAYEATERAGPADIAPAIGKAYTAARLGQPTRAIDSAARNPKTGFDLAGFGDARLSALVGGVPVEHGGETVGGVGVSGAAPDTDEALAEAGVAAMLAPYAPVAAGDDEEVAVP